MTPEELFEQEWGCMKGGPFEVRLRNGDKYFTKHCHMDDDRIMAVIKIPYEELVTFKGSKDPSVIYNVPSTRYEKRVVALPISSLDMLVLGVEDEEAE